MLLNGRFLFIIVASLTFGYIREYLTLLRDLMISAALENENSSISSSQKDAHTRSPSEV